jgi:hypothetical protein
MIGSKSGGSESDLAFSQIGLGSMLPQTSESCETAEA